MSKNKRISDKMLVKYALLKNSIEILFKSNRKCLNMIVVVKQALRKQNASQNTKSVKRAMRKKKSLLSTTSQDVVESSLFCLKDTIIDYENLESKDVI